MLPVFIFETVVEFVWSNIGEFVTTIKAEPLLLIPVGLGFVGSIVAIGKRLFTFGRRHK